jgi:hypothetical protein
MALAVGMEVGLLLGYAPSGSVLYRVLAHLGWTFAWAGIYRRARTHAQAAELGTPPNGAPAARPGTSGLGDGPPSVR